MKEQINSNLPIIPFSQSVKERILFFRFYSTGLSSFFASARVLRAASVAFA